MSTSPDGKAPVGATLVGQYLTFLLDREVFAIGILAVKEIIEYGTPTEVPMAASWFRGVINLRGAAVPVIDLAARLGRRPAQAHRRTCIIIVEIEGARGRELQGLMVDAVNQVLDIPAADIEPPPAGPGAHGRSDLVAGMGRVDGRFVILLDIQCILTADYPVVLAAATSPPGLAAAPA